MVAMKTALLVLTYIAKVTGFVAALGGIPFLSPEIGIYVILGASILKDTVNRAGDLLDDGKANSSFGG